MMVYQNNFVASVKVGGRILREHDKDHVYLPFGSEYSILLKNMQNRRSTINIKIDGNDVLSGHQLILDAKRTMELERFIVNGNLNSGPRFKFIEKTEQISEHRGDRIEDGIIEIDYQFEIERPVIKINPIPIKEIHHYWHQPDWRYTYRGNTGENPMEGVYNTSITGQSVGSSGSSVTLDEVGSDEGITVKGTDCDQQFRIGHIGVLESVIHNICIKLHGSRNKGIIQEPLTVQRKLKCEVCGHQSDSRQSYCGVCGNNLTW
jgi:hypothetical protein